MAHQLGHNQYGKAETRVVRIYRDIDPHEIVDYNVSAALSGDFADTHLTGDNAKVLTTDGVKNTVNAFAKEHGEEARQPESFGLALARHFVEDVPQVSRARVRIEAYPWLRLHAGGTPHPHAFVRAGQYTRTTTVTYADGRSWIVSGLRDLTVLKTTDSEFWGFYQDRYTTLQPTNDRVMATSVAAQWWHTSDDVDWSKSFDSVRDALCEAFAVSYSYALQQTLFEMGSAVLDAVPGIAEVRLSLPNKHHFVVDLSPFGLDNPNEVFHADDRPYGLIEGTVRREDAPDPGPAFDPGQGW
ncbi:factor-independent urate hydroxylase [Geodermatophilus sp. URMC 64]